MIEFYPSLRAITAFDATARLGSFTAAAADLNVTQGAVSRQVQELERLLGVDLFDRAGPKIVLNDAGLSFAETAAKVLTDLRGGIAEVRRATDRTHVTLTMLPSVAAKWLAPRLGRFLSDNPDIDLRVSASRRLSELAAEGIDAAVRYGGGNWAGLDAELLARETVFPVCAPHYAETLGLAEPADLLNAILLPAEIAEDWPIWFAQAGVAPDTIGHGPQLGDYAAILQAAIDGHGVALGRSVLVADDLAAGRLVAPFEIELTASSGYWFAVPEQATLSADLIRTRDWIAREFQAAAPKR